jgi:chemotaxis protein CheD
MSLLVTGVADCQASADTDVVLVTYALGSCIGLLVHDPAARVGGLLHFMLPNSGIDAAKADKHPYMFADTGIPRLLEKVCRLGGETRRLVVTAVGGAQVLDFQGAFNIGKQNHLALRKILRKTGVLLHSEEIGGTASRTVRLEVATGRVLLRTGDQPEQELTTSLSLSRRLPCLEVEATLSRET